LESVIIFSDLPDRAITVNGVGGGVAARLYGETVISVLTYGPPACRP